MALRLVDPIWVDKDQKETNKENAVGRVATHLKIVSQEQYQRKVLQQIAITLPFSVLPRQQKSQ